MEYDIKVSEETMLELRLDTMIPFSMTVRENAGTTEIEAYEAVMPIVKEWIEMYGDDPLCDKGLCLLEKGLSEFCTDNGYEFCGYRNLKNMYICTADTKLKKSDKIDVKEIDCGAEYKSALEMELTGPMYDGDDYPYRAAGVFDGDLLVSACCENSHYFNNDTETEVGVETAEKYRQLGYAAAATAELCRILRDNGREKIYYECSTDNTASVKTAEKAGLDFYGKTYYFVSYIRE